MHLRDVCALKTLVATKSLRVLIKRCNIPSTLLCVAPLDIRLDAAVICDMFHFCIELCARESEYSITVSNTITKTCFLVVLRGSDQTMQRPLARLHPLRQPHAPSPSSGVSIPSSGPLPALDLKLGHERAGTRRSARLVVGRRPNHLVRSTPLAGSLLTTPRTL